MNVIAIIGCLMAGAAIGVCVMSIFVAGSQADDWADRYERAESDAALRERMSALYPEQRKVL